MRSAFIFFSVISALTSISTNILSQELNPADNPLIGTWILSQKGYGGCDEKRIFSEHTQTWYTNGQTVKAPATYAKSGSTIYVQQRTGSGGTVAFVVLSQNEIMDTLGTNACHWIRQ